MQELLFTIDAILPMILLIILGYILKLFGVLDDNITKGLNKFTFVISIPVLVFYNIYNIEELIIDTNLIIFSIITILILFILGIIFNIIFKTDDKNKGILLQNFFRTNASTMGFQVIALMGISSYAETNVVAMIGVSVALYNMLGVIAFQLYDKTNGKIKLVNLIIKILTNPIVIGILLGFFAQFLRTLIGYEWFSQNLNFVYIAVRDVAKISSPVALIALGASFYFKSFNELKKEIIVGVLIHSVIIPIIIFGVAIIFREQLGFNENHFPALIAIILPSLAVSVAPMADNMNGNSKLAGQLIVWTTIASSVTMFIVIYILKSLLLV